MTFPEVENFNKLYLYGSNNNKYLQHQCQSLFFHQFNAVEQQVIVEILLQVEQTVQIGLVSSSPPSYRNLARSRIGRITIGGSDSSVNNLKTLQIIESNSYFCSFSYVFVEIEHTMSLVTDLHDDNIYSSICRKYLSYSDQWRIHHRCPSLLLNLKLSREALSSSLEVITRYVLRPADLFYLH